MGDQEQGDFTDGRAGFDEALDAAAVDHEIVQMLLIDLVGRPHRRRAGPEAVARLAHPLTRPAPEPVHQTHGADSAWSGLNHHIFARLSRTRLVASTGTEGRCCDAPDK
jgi:hypothetical protein